MLEKGSPFKILANLVENHTPSDQSSKVMAANASQTKPAKSVLSRKYKKEVDSANEQCF